mmetsp:Transcript_4351/g.10511  ORF Transcript_4351/g.10511 Transcript_4351/m.10511 type:complete len:213 (-) Transcript_4351:345-983(-)
MYNSSIVPWITLLFGVGLLRRGWLRSGTSHSILQFHSFKCFLLLKAEPGLRTCLRRRKVRTAGNLGEESLFDLSHVNSSAHRQVEVLGCSHSFNRNTAEVLPKPLEWRCIRPTHHQTHSKCLLQLVGLQCRTNRVQSQRFELRHTEPSGEILRLALHVRHSEESPLTCSHSQRVPDVATIVQHIHALPLESPRSAQHSAQNTKIRDSIKCDN